MVMLANITFWCNALYFGVIVQASVHGNAKSAGWITCYV